MEERSFRTWDSEPRIAGLARRLDPQRGTENENILPKTQYRRDKLQAWQRIFPDVCVRRTPEGSIILARVSSGLPEADEPHFTSVSPAPAAGCMGPIRQENARSSAACGPGEFGLP